MYLTELTTKSACVPLEVRRHSLVFHSVAAHHPGSSPPTPFPSLFPLFQQCDGCLFLLLRGAHGWVTRICRHVLKPGTPEHPGTRELPEHPGTPRNTLEHPGTPRNTLEHRNTGTAENPGTPTLTVLFFFFFH